MHIEMQKSAVVSEQSSSPSQSSSISSDTCIRRSFSLRYIAACTMFKRRDWVHMHGQDGEDSSDEDSSGASERNDDSGSSADSGDSSTASEASEGNGHQQEAKFGAKRLQDLSEDDFEPDDALQEPKIDVLELVQNWLTAPDAEQLKMQQGSSQAAGMQGPPLRCRWCPGTLLLSATSLKTHISSKRHQKKQKLSEDQPHPICLAEDFDGDDTEEAETHAERLQRLRKISAPPDLSGLSTSQRRKLMRKLKAEQRNKAALHRPGKRQRAEMKAEVFKAAAGGKPQKPTLSSKAKKSQDTRDRKNKAQHAGICKKLNKRKG